MKEKLTITKDNYKEVVLKKSIITCWIILAVCFIVKICGGNFFTIVCNNENFIELCYYIDNTYIKYIEGYVSFIISSVMLLLITKKDKKVFTKSNFIFVVFCSLYWAFKILISLNIIKIGTLLYNIIDIFVLYLLLFIFSRKPLKPVFVIALMTIFTIISSITKNIGINGSIIESSLIANIYLIDYYIMLVLSVLYSIKIERRK